jgi:sugar phosphate isomerase/epimerase
VLRRGLKARPHDLAEVMAMSPEMVEFHADSADLDKEIEGVHGVPMALHVPEYDGSTLLDLSSGDDAARMKSVALCEKAMSTARKWATHFRGDPKIVVHPGGWSSDPLQASHKPALYANFAASVAAMNTHGVDFLVENMPPNPWFYGGQWHCNHFMDPRECRDFCSENAIGLCLDLCHLFLWCNHTKSDFIKAIQIMRPVTAHIHFSDARGTDGEGLQIGDGDIPIKEMFEAIGQVQVGWIPEIWQSHKDNFKEMRRVWPLVDALKGA